MKGIFFVLAIVMAAAVTACTQGPEPIRWGTDMCDHCRMILGDKRFAAELVADRVYKFDGVDELAKFQAAHPEKQGVAYVSDGESGNLVPAQQAVYLRTSTLTAPMGGHVISFANRPEAERFVAQHQLADVAWLSFANALQEVGAKGTVPPAPRVGEGERQRRGKPAGGSHARG